MSNESKSDSGTRRNFASRLLNKAIQDRKTGEIQKPDLTTAEAQKYAVQSAENKETATAGKS